MSTPGEVILVGAGPGDPGLITVSGLAAVRRADCLIYDRLVAPELVREARPDCERIYVGKADHHHTLPQDEINALLVAKARTHRCVVRLKGGDPFVFGRGGEELNFLRAHGIACSVVPGVTSAIAVPAAAAIPVTQRGVARAFHVFTAHDRDDKLADIDFTKLTDPRETCVFLMGLSLLGEIVARLRAAGRAASTPVAVIANGTLSDQRTVTGTLADIVANVAAAGLASPATIVVGDVVEACR